MPEAHAAMREVKAEGGWAVVSTEECEIHPSGDVSPYIEARLWDDQDIPALALMCEKVHAHGALAAVELEGVVGPALRRDQQIVTLGADQEAVLLHLDVGDLLAERQRIEGDQEREPLPEQHLAQ